jgi:hypothetical protein
MKNFGLVISALLIALMLFSVLPTINIVKAQPRSDLDIVWYTNDDAAFTAMKNGEVDIVQWSLTKLQKEATEADPNLAIGQYVENGMMEFDLNNNETIMDYPTSTNPLYFADFRRAIAYMVDKNYIISNILEYFGSEIDVPVAYPQTEGWVNASVVTYDWNHNGVIDPSEDNYPYKYDPNAAAAILAQMGFSDTDGNGYLNYPNDPTLWGDAAGKDTTQMPLKICIRSDHTHRLAAGRYLVAQLEGDPAVANDSILARQPAWALYGKVGGDFDTTDATWEQPRKVLSPIVMRDRNYHIYTGGWSFGRFPTYLFSLFHSMFWYPYGPNYVNPNGQYDDILHDIYYAATIEDAQKASRDYTYWHVKDCINIPLWSYTNYVAWRKTLAGVVNEKGYGTVNDYTFLNAYRTDAPGAPIRMGCVSGWDRLNILYSQWYFEYALLDRVYTGLISANPYDLAVDIPWAAQDWQVGTWVDPRDGLTKTVVTYWLRKDVGCASPVNGSSTGNFKYDDYEFTVWYNYAFDDSWQWSSFMDIHHLEKVNDYTIKVYFDDVSMWFVYAPTYPLLGPKEKLAPLLTEQETVTFYGENLTNPVGAASSYFEYQFTNNQTVQILSATRNGNPITEGVDFYIRAGYDVFCHNVFVNLTSFAPTDVITITYLKPIAGGAGGTYMGGNLGYSWEDTMYSYGTYYPISISATSASLNKNPYFFLETPLLGEIDWRWYWQGTTKPRSGYFKVDILDVVKVTGAYCSRGDGAFNPIYLAGADIDGSDLGHIGILDLVSITGKYAQTFGTPP